MTSVTLGYTIFYVEDVGECLRFFSNAFGFEQRMHTPENDYGELATGDTTLAFVDLALASANLDASGGFLRPHPDLPGSASVTLVTADIGSVLTTAVEAGARSYVDPIEKPWGQTVAYLLGPSNILIEVATPIAST